MKQDNTNVYL